MDSNDLRRLIAYSDWANLRMLAALEQVSDRSPDAVRLFAHVITTDGIYLERMKRNDPFPQNFWPEVPLAEIEGRMKANGSAYRSFIDSLGDVDERVSYRNSKGERFNTSIADMLTHLSIHGAHHRGQILHAMRQSGRPSVNLDFITFVREADQSKL
ncbi:MAG TPA: DinB family protein [Thermoanaerobaculia bacterium]|nr:DinB family protein [Thermoanaerobaculia bacterium]